MKEIFKTDKFKDFKGNERSFTVCGVLLNEKDNIEMTTVVDNVDEVIRQRDNDNYDFMEYPDTMLRIGISFCHEHDDHIPELGETLARGRAMKEGSTQCVFTSTSGLILNIRLAHIILDHIVSDIKYAPGKYIKGYNEMEEKYLKNQSEKSNE